MKFKRSEADETFIREQTARGFHIGWTDSTTGKPYDYWLGRQEDIDTALCEDGINPDDFFKQVGTY